MIDVNFAMTAFLAGIHLRRFHNDHSYRQASDGHVSLILVCESSADRGSFLRGSSKQWGH